MYGRGEASIAEQLGVTVEEARQLKEDVYKALPKLKEFIEESEKVVREKGYVKTLWNYKRRLPDFNLPEVQVFYGKEIYSKTDKQNIIVASEALIPDAISDSIIKEYLGIRNFDKREDYIEKLKENRKYVLVDNRSKKSAAQRQIANSIIQGCLYFHNLVLDKKLGLIRLGDYINQDMELWDGEGWTKCWIADSGKKQECKVSFKDGTQHISSPDHQYQVVKIGGNKIFKKAEDLKTGDRVVITSNLPENDYQFTSNKEVCYHTTKDPFFNEFYFEDLLENNSRYEVGQLMGRLASDGYYCKKDSSKHAIQLSFAEHEFCIIPQMEKVVSCWENRKANISKLRENRKQRLARLTLNSPTLLNECHYLNLKYSIHPSIMGDTELLRGFLSGVFDGDGYMGKAILCLKLGKHRDYIPFLRDIQFALKLFGIRSNVRVQNDGSQILTVKNSDIPRFSKYIGFLNPKKQLRCESFKPIKNDKSFKGERFLLVESVEVTDNFVPMCDVMDTDRGKFMVEGVITHNSSSNMTKRALLEIYNNEQLNALKCYALIPVHDEIIAVAPYRYAKPASELFAKAMEDAPKEKLEVHIKCDVDIFFNWAGESITNLLGEELSEADENIIID